MAYFLAGFVRVRTKTKELIEYVERLYLATKLVFLIHKLKKLLDGNSELIKENQLLTGELLRLESERKARLQSQRSGNP